MVTGCCDVAQKVSTNVKIESEKKKFENFLKNAFLNSTFSNVAGLSFELFSNPFFFADNVSKNTITAVNKHSKLFTEQLT